jgi:DNA polymerase III sliding clamp (beta) subunit (PCNA family)
MPLMALEDYPTVVFPKAGHLIMLDPSDRAGLLRSTTSVGRDDTLPILTQVHLTAKAGERIEAVTTDRYRLTRQRLHAVAEQDLDAVVGATWLSTALHATTRVAGDVTMLIGPGRGITATAKETIGADYALIASGAAWYASRMLEGAEYPKINSVYPTAETAVTVDVDADTLRTAVRRAAAGGLANVPVVLRPHARKALTVSSSTGDVLYESIATVEGAKCKGKIDATFKDTTGGFALNPHYLQEALRDMTGHKIRIEIRLPNKPIVLTSDTIEGYLHLLMPVRLAG